MHALSSSSWNRHRNLEIHESPENLMGSSSWAHIIKHYIMRHSKRLKSVIYIYADSIKRFLIKLEYTNVISQTPLDVGPISISREKCFCRFIHRLGAIVRPQGKNLGQERIGRIGVRKNRKNWIRPKSSSIAV